VARKTTARRKRTDTEAGIINCNTRRLHA